MAGRHLSTTISITTQWCADPLIPDAPGKWFAVGTVSYYDPGHSVPGLNRVQVSLTGEALVSVTVRSAADSEKRAAELVQAALWEQVELRRERSESRGGAGEG